MQCIPLLIVVPFLLQDVCISCGLVATAAITFVIMFLPKGRQLSAMGRDGVYAEDRTDVYTGSSSTQSTGKITLFGAIISYILESLNIQNNLSTLFEIT